MVLGLQIAASLKAEKLILMTDVPGVLRDKDDVGTKFTALDIRQVRELVADGIIAGGMIPKCEPHMNASTHEQHSCFC
jgi:acetylglutamate kinase